MSENSSQAPEKIAQIAVAKAGEFGSYEALYVLTTKGALWLRGQGRDSSWKPVDLPPGVS